MEEQNVNDKTRMNRDSGEKASTSCRRVYTDVLLIPSDKPV